MSGDSGLMQQRRIFWGEGEKLVRSGALFVKYKLWSSVIRFLSVWVVSVGTSSEKAERNSSAAESWDPDWRLGKVACCVVSLLCDCIVLALSEQDRKEKVACCCVSSASLDSLLFGYSLLTKIIININMIGPFI
jgi:hypothetical protein